jgi:hypothetical protein
MMEISPKVVELRTRLEAFMVAHVYPNERRYYEARAECSLPRG